MVSKSYLPFGAGSNVAPAAEGTSEVLDPTAPTRAVIPAFLRNALRFSPSIFDIRWPPGFKASTVAGQRQRPRADSMDTRNTTPVWNVFLSRIRTSHGLERWS